MNGIDPLEVCQGDAVSINPQIPYVAMIRGPWWDDEGYQRAERINGCVACPDCGLLWPFREEVEVWIKKDGRWYASEWGPGAAECIECGLVMIDGGEDASCCGRTMCSECEVWCCEEHDEDCGDWFCEDCVEEE